MPMNKGTSRREGYDALAETETAVPADEREADPFSEPYSLPRMKTARKRSQQTHG